MNTALATTNSGCRPPGMSMRLSSHTAPRPLATPSALPSAACWPRRPSSSHPGAPPETMSSASTMVRNTATGSLVPDSTSSIERARWGSCRPPERSRKNTAAASVEATMLPSSRASRKFSWGRTSTATRPVRTAVMTTPTVAIRTCWCDDTPEGAEFGPQPAVEQDDGQRQGADGVGELVVAEHEAAHAVLAQAACRAPGRREPGGRRIAWR
jgi:hypothetical protein